MHFSDHFVSNVCLFVAAKVVRHSTSQLCKGVFIATQLNSTQLTQLNSVQASQSCFVYDVTTYKLSQLLFTL